MKLFECIGALKKHKRIYREHWGGEYLVKSLLEDMPLIEIDHNSMIMRNYQFSYEDLIAEDWHVFEDE